MKTPKYLIKALERKQVKLAKLRDELREVQDQYETVLGDVDEALTELDACIEALSRQQ